jgi:hypothetical protein
MWRCARALCARHTSRLAPAAYTHPQPSAFSTPLLITPLATAPDASKRLRAPARPLRPAVIRLGLDSWLSALACPPSAYYWPSARLSCLRTSWITRACRARMLSCSWAFVVHRCLSTFLFSFTSTPTITLISTRISARARPDITPTGSPDARYARAHPHELRTPTHALSRHCYPVSTLAHTLSARTTPHVRPSYVGGCRARAGTHARPRSTRRTELDDEGLAGRSFGPVCRRFRVYKHPHRFTHPPAIHPSAHPSFPRPSQPQSSQQPPALARRPSFRPREPSPIVSNPRANSLPFPSPLSQHPHTLPIHARFNGEPLRAHQRSTRSPAAETRPPPPSDSISGHTSPRADIHHRRHTLRGAFSVLPQGRSRHRSSSRPNTALAHRNGSGPARETARWTCAWIISLRVATRGPRLGALYSQCLPISLVCAKPMTVTSITHSCVCIYTS